MLKKTIAIGMSAALLAGTLAGCGEKKTVTSNSDTTKISISFWEPGTANELEKAFTEITKDYKAIHPEVDIEIMAQPYSGYQEWIKTRLASGTLPNIVYNETSQISDLNTAGHIEQLDEALGEPNDYAGGKTWNDIFVPGKVPVTDGKRLSVPISGLGLAYYYNKDMYKQYGLEEPKTWTEFLNNCQVIEDNGVNPVAFMAQKQDAVNWLQWQVCTGLYGDMFLEDENINANMDNTITETELCRAVDTGYLDVTKPGKWQDAYLNFIDIVRTYSKYAHNAAGLDEAGAKAQFLAGKAAHLYSGSWDVQAFLVDAKAPFEIGAFSFPSFTKEDGEYAGASMTIPQVSCLAVTKNDDAKKVEAAKDFLKFITSPDEYKKYVEITRCIPSVADLDVDSIYNAFIGGVRKPILFFGMKGAKSQYSSYDAVIGALIGNELGKDEMLEKVQQANVEHATEYLEKHGMSAENDYNDIHNQEKQDGDYKSSAELMGE